MTAPRTKTLAGLEERWPLVAGATERAEVACRGLRTLPAAASGHEADFKGIVQLLAHRESQGFTWLGFADGDVVDFDRYDENDASEEAEAVADLRRPCSDHRDFWDLLVCVHREAAAAGSHFAVEHGKPIPTSAEFAIDLKRMRLWFARAADNDRRLWEMIDKRTGATPATLSPATEGILEALFPVAAVGTAKADSRVEQLAAARLIATRGISVLTGPPGTGKTFTLVRAALAWLCAELDKQSDEAAYVPRPIRLMAPTGRASSRMREVINEALAKIEADPIALKALGPKGSAAIRRLRDECMPSTIHSALERSIAVGTPFKRTRANPLDAGLVIVDESSMIGLELARQLFDALPDDTQICLVGDPDQLRAVEIGSVLQDIVGRAATNKQVAACHAELTVGHRFPPGSMIDKLAKAIRDLKGKDSKVAWSDVLAGEKIMIDKFIEQFESLTVERNPVDPQARVLLIEVTERELPDVARQIIAIQADDLRRHAADKDIKATLRRSVVLSPVRRGKLGAYTLADSTLPTSGSKTATNPYDYPDGTPIIITRNNRDLNLFNGDLAIVRTSKKGRKIAHFADKRELDVRILPSFMPAAALTVHKAQGSEWNLVVAVLPVLAISADSIRLLYTACTRAARVLVLIMPSQHPHPKD